MDAGSLGSHITLPKGSHPVSYRFSRGNVATTLPWLPPLPVSLRAALQGQLSAHPPREPFARCRGAARQRSQKAAAEPGLLQVPSFTVLDCTQVLPACVLSWKGLHSPLFL